MDANRDPAPRSPEDELCDSVLAYLAEHPTTMDTLEGIAEWWILRTDPPAELARLRRALRRLCALGVVEELDTGHARCYRLQRPGNGR